MNPDRRQKPLRPALRVLLAIGFALASHPLLAQPTTTETVCPEKELTFSSAENYNAPGKTLFACFYKPATPGVPIVSEPLEVKGRCRLKRTDEIADLVNRNEPGKFVANIEKCRGDRLTCTVVCISD